MDNSDLLEIVPTRAQLLQKNKVADYKATVFEAYKSKPKGETIDQWKNFKPPKEDVIHSDCDDEEEFYQRRPPKRKQTDDTEFDIKKARADVMKLAVSGGYRKEKNKKKAEIAMLIKLGAKPPPRPHRNYKELLEEKSRTKKIQTERAKFYQLGKNKTGSATVKCRNNKNNRKPIVSGISQNYGVVNPKLKKKRKN